VTVAIVRFAVGFGSIKKYKPRFTVGFLVFMGADFKHMHSNDREYWQKHLDSLTLALSSGGLDDEVN